jgi:hypothetical protein
VEATAGAAEGMAEAEEVIVAAVEGAAGAVEATEAAAAR